eukprot:15199-Prymnesium_polylepis.1
MSFRVNGTTPSSAQPFFTRSSEKASTHGARAARADATSSSTAAAISSWRVGSRPAPAAFARAAWNCATIASFFATSCAGWKTEKCAKSSC